MADGYDDYSLSKMVNTTSVGNGSKQQDQVLDLQQYMGCSYADKCSITHMLPSAPNVNSVGELHILDAASYARTQSRIARKKRSVLHHKKEYYGLLSPRSSVWPSSKHAHERAWGKSRRGATHPSVIAAASQNHNSHRESNNSTAITKNINKTQAEKFLPSLGNGENVFLAMEDFTGARKWNFKFSHWRNNKSRMYLLKNTGEFVTYHDLKAKDVIIIYKNHALGKYVVFAEKALERLSITSSNALRLPLTCPSQEEDRKRKEHDACFLLDCQGAIVEENPLPTHSMKPSENTSSRDEIQMFGDMNLPLEFQGKKYEEHNLPLHGEDQVNRITGTIDDLHVVDVDLDMFDDVDIWMNDQTNKTTSMIDDLDMWVVYDIDKIHIIICTLMTLNDELEHD
ncbi:hypothetical protein O6H91_04G022300 [Diphasiastrum complanatum]|uniref:Uncharacterized protein n=1 Tax=Diphasiastrum complanatum TaxID=34168 RepID=A0ACC2DUU9_DIPCM|nr:hypothetical protein O6H91_04G022300 [Diphasiastrum complanatum]